MNYTAKQALVPNSIRASVHQRNSVLLSALGLRNPSQGGTAPVRLADFLCLTIFSYPGFPDNSYLSQESKGISNTLGSTFVAVSKLLALPIWGIFSIKHKGDRNV